MNQDARLVEHVCVCSEEELEPLKLSKYYQSNTKYTYRDVNSYLDEGVLVLYSGTACQIAGLYAYLGKTYENLITVDVLCHGVGSKKIVDAYVKSKEHYFKKKVKKIFFRHKDNITGWQNGGSTRMKLIFEDGSAYIAKNVDDTFFIGFNENFFLRESCYICKFCGTKRVADFTIADFWGCDREEVSEDQKKLGVSLILANTEKADGILEKLRSEDVLTLYEADPQEAIPYNRSLDKPNDRPAQRDKFYKWISIFGYDLVIKRIFWKKFTKLKIKEILGRS